MSHLALLIPLAAQSPVEIRVQSATRQGPLRPVWAWFGYDEPNYTYMPHGAKLIGELSALGDTPVYIRAHNLLTTGDGTPALKWGSTNAYREDAAGNPVYDWTILDRIFDTYVKAHAKPMVELGFMPEALSTHPQPYRHTWPDGGIDTGWAYPPKDYAKWTELVRQLALHAVERYGREEVESWYWEVWNEPDIMYWHGTPDEYNRLYDASVAGVRLVLPKAMVGGPATTGPASAKAAAFLKQFLEHCAGTGTPLDFVSYHAKGQPRVVDGHVRMGLSKNLEDVARGIEVLQAFPQYRNLPIILSESDPEGCAACSARTHPPNAYRNGVLYASYTAAAYKNILDLAASRKANIAGMLSWSFEFENQPYFDGFRTLATNGVDKPVLNFFRMAGLMRGERVAVESAGAPTVDTLVRDGAHGSAPYVDALASRTDREISILVWNYHDDDVKGPDAPVRLRVAGVPSSAKRVLVRHFRIDEQHSNAYTEWKRMGSPQNPDRAQQAQLEASGQLQLLESPRWIARTAGDVELRFALPRQSVSLVQLVW